MSEKPPGPEEAQLARLNELLEAKGMSVADLIADLEAEQAPKGDPFAPENDPFGVSGEVKEVIESPEQRERREQMDAFLEEHANPDPISVTMKKDKIHLRPALMKAIREGFVDDKGNRVVEKLEKKSPLSGDELVAYFQSHPDVFREKRGKTRMNGEDDVYIIRTNNDLLIYVEDDGKMLSWQLLKKSM